MSNFSFNNNLIFVNTKYDLLKSVGGVRMLGDNITYFITDVIDLDGDRLVCGQNTTLIGGSSENCRLKSSGLIGEPLITSNYSLPIRNITIEADIALNLSGDSVTTAIDWAGVNFSNCETIGSIKNYANFIMSESAFLNSGGLIFDGTFGTISFTSCLFDANSNNTVITLANTLTVARRFRTIYSSFIVLSGETGINVNTGATIPTESYILDTVNFGGGDTYITGVDQTSNDTIFINCVGVDNTSVNGQLYIQNNAIETIVSETNTFYNIMGTSSGSTDNSKFTFSGNRLTCDAIIDRKYLIQANLSFTSGNNNVCEFGFYDSQLDDIRTPSRTKSTANSAGRSENITLFCITNMNIGDYIEIRCSNTSTITNIIVEQLNFIITEIK